MPATRPATLFERSLQDAAGAPLSVDLATLEQQGGTTTLEVYGADGKLIGKLELEYTKGAGTDDSLAYTFTPDEDYLNNLPVGEKHDIDFTITVSDKHDGARPRAGTCTSASATRTTRRSLMRASRKNRMKATRALWCSRTPTSGIRTA